MQQTSYRDLEWELIAPRDGKKRILNRFDQSIDRTKGTEWRHPYPWEVYGLLNDGFNSKLAERFTYVFEDFKNKCYGEWFNLAFYKKGNILVTYLDPEGIIYDGKKYNISGEFKYSEKREFDIGDKKPYYIYDLSTFKEDFIKFIHGCPLTEIHTEIKDSIFVPPEDSIWPYGRNYRLSDGSYFLWGYPPNFHWTSRLVRKINTTGEKR